MSFPVKERYVYSVVGQTSDDERHEVNVTASNEIEAISFVRETLEFVLVDSISKQDITFVL